MKQAPADPCEDFALTGLMPADRQVFRAPMTDVLTTARLLGVSRATVDRAIKRGNVPATRVAGRHRIPTAWLLAAIRGGLDAAA